MKRALAIVFLVACLGLPFDLAASQPLESRQQEAERLRAELAEHGRRLSMAAEDHNEARYRHQQVIADLAATRAKVAVAEERWREHSERLGKRARALYMYPGAALEAWLGMRSLTDASRAAALSGAVLENDVDLMAATQSARRELEKEAEGLVALRSQTERMEADLAAGRSVLERRMAEQRSVLLRVESQIAELIEAQRQAEIEAARRTAEEALAAEEAARVQELVGDDEPAEEVEPEAMPQTGPAAARAVRAARQQIGKPYQWGASGPDSFDCSGLTMYAWAAAGVQLPHSSRAQYASLPKVKRANLQPGDLVFFGSPIHHVGIYEGGGVMINSPETGETVRRNSIARSDFAGAARPG